GRKVQVQVRQRDDRGQVTMAGQEMEEEEILADVRDVLGLGEELTTYRVPDTACLQPLRIYPFGVSRPKLEQAIRDMRLPVTLVRDIDEADLLLTLKNYYRRKPPALRDAESHGKPVYVLKNNTMAQMQSCLAGIYELDSSRTAAGSAASTSPSPNGPPMMEALQEAEDAIPSALDQGHTVDLAPQNSY